jgi:phosphate transport system protein
MREEFHAELAEVSGLLVAMADEVRSAMKRATSALLKPDAGVAKASSRATRS